MVERKGLAQSDTTANGFKRGDLVVVTDYSGKRLRRRVWADSGDGIAICREDDYERALVAGVEPLYAGFPKDAIVEVLSADLAAESESGPAAPSKLVE